MNNKKGFTLIELLAVIIILGILMIIAIPSVTKYISDSRKNAYIDTAKEVISGARNLVNDGKLEMFDTDTSYYIDIKCIKSENGVPKSPYGEFAKAYIVVNYDGKGYEYFWTSVDEAGEGIKNITRNDKLDPDLIESDLTSDDISYTLGVDGRNKYMLIDKEHTNCGKSVASPVTDTVSGETGTNPVVYPEGKNKSTVVMGDVVKIGSEEFYVIKHQGNDLVLLAKYSLKAGAISNYDWETLYTYSPSDEGYGLQSPDMIGITTWEPGYTYYGTTIFSEDVYWLNKVGTEYQGEYCHEGSNYTPGTNCLYVYDSHSSVYPYINYYKNYLSSLGASIKEARLMKYEEAYELGCRSINSARKWDCLDGPAWVYTSTYWLGTADYASSQGNRDEGWVWSINIDGDFYTDYTSDFDGYSIRPVIVI